MADVPLSVSTQRRLELLFAGQEAKEASELLVRECGANLPFLQELGASELERFRYAALKLSAGRIDLLGQAIGLAKRDWRDLLMAADFGHDIHAHEQWVPEPPSD